VKQLITACVEVGIHHVVVETNGPGGFVPAIARKHATSFGITIEEEFSIVKKNERILDAFEAPLSSGFLYAHRQVFESGAAEQMRQFNPGVKDQPDDYLDAGAGAIARTPVRVERIAGQTETVHHWKYGAKDLEVTLEYNH
ncbi:MAG: transcriptional regulator, partial [Acidobacteria bacterium]|nr:transcriptional regulator [Acidobacteriota bacterium]